MKLVAFVLPIEKDRPRGDPVKAEYDVSMIGSMTPQREQLLALSFLFLLPSTEIKASANWLLKYRGSITV